MIRQRDRHGREPPKTWECLLYDLWMGYKMCCVPLLLAYAMQKHFLFKYAMEDIAYHVPVLASWGHVSVYKVLRFRIF